MNKIMLIGNLGKDWEMKKSKAGKPFAKNTMATCKRPGPTSWHRLIAFNKTAETLAQYTQKGTKLYVEGSVQYGSYEKNGQKIYTTDILVDRFEFVESKSVGPTKPDAPQSDKFQDEDIPF